MMVDYLSMCLIREMPEQYGNRDCFCANRMSLYCTCMSSIGSSNRLSEVSSFRAPRRANDCHCFVPTPSNRDSGKAILLPTAR